MTTLKTVDVKHVAQTWPFVEAFIDAAVQQVPPEIRTYDTPHVQQFVSSGAWQLLVVVDDTDKILGAFTISFNNYPKHRVAVVTTLGGKHVVSHDTIAQFKKYCHSCGATQIHAFCRPAMVRFLKRYGYEPRTTLVELPM